MIDDPTKSLERAPMLGYLNQKVISAVDGTSHVEAMPSEIFYNPMGRVHGGFAAALIDTALGVSVLTKLPEGTQYGTVDLNVKFVRKIDADTGVLHARGKVVHAGRTMLTAEARIEDAEGKLYAHGSGTFLVYPKQ
jgi:acyl-CoA thioesterase